ncbi:MAG TPA: hypothetical protein VH325_00690 [Bryobacteraceae bacterium]|nr:hypothetical protein [Bryobacteraceae bacterium]
MELQPSAPVAGQKEVLSNGTVAPGPYLPGNPAFTGDGTGQVRLNATVGPANYNALQTGGQHGFANGLNS